MQKKLTVLFAFAIFVLVIGVTDSYACDDGFKHRNPFPPCGGGSEDPASATMELGGDMFAMDFPVSIIQDNFKKLHLQNQGFDSQLIEMRSNVSTADCFVDRGDVNNLELAEMVDLLKTGDITSGDIYVEVDRKKGTGFFVVQYNDMVFGVNQQIRIKYGMGAGFALDEFSEDPTDTFHYLGTIIVWLTELANPDQQIVACRGQTLDITLHRTTGQQ